MAAVAMSAAVIASPLTACVSKDLSSTASLRTTKASVFVKQVSSRTVCSVSKEETVSEKAGKAVSAVALAAIISAAPFAAPQDAFADISGLTPCKESKAFAKREKNEIKKLQGRLKLYAPESAPALALQKTVEKTQRRFAFYGSQGLLCGSDGYPHLIVSGDQRHLGEFVFPGVVFLYIAGWIGWVGREYLIKVRDTKSPTNKEIIIDVPLALNIMSTGATWPLAAVSALRNGTLIEDDANITVSPR
eukprot:jgi/Mesen1/526/ME000104S10625